ncbi:hypothetical protein F2P81_008476 [Scophthalmus maximus]|uniref:Uncharacterized protein n=1 Tax=Scophthalmus maximus TaxID=52904 RepID=A0A6A4TBE6_SCOMX|nr:hypothetical protein F2P81_008476 [Scophthalmus maximus]
MTSMKWTHLPVSLVQVLVLILVKVQVQVLTGSVSAARSDRNMVSEEYVGATVNATVLDGRGNTIHMMSSDDGTYGQNSPKVDTRGVIIAPAPHHGGTGDTVAVMITEGYGKEILAHLDRNLTVTVSVVVGQRGPTRNINRGSLVFVSISFIVLMIISSAWLIFYFIQKIRYTSARDRSQRRLGDAAKKAMGKLTTRTVKKGDKTSLPCVDSVVLDVERLGVSQASSSQRAPLGDGNQPSISLEPLNSPHPEATPRTPADITVAVTSGGHFFNRNSMSPRSIVCEMELPDIQASLDLYDDNKS